MARRTKEEALETRLKILAAAEEVFFDHGVAQTSLDEIATKAGVTRGAIYWHFRNKADLFRALYERVQLPQQEIIERAVADGHPDALAVLEEAILDVFSLLAQDEQRQRVFTILVCRCEYVGEMLEVLEWQRDANERMRATLLRAFEAAKAQGTLAAAWTPQDASNICMSLIVGLIVDWVRYGRRFDLVAQGGTSLKRLVASFRQTA